MANNTDITLTNLVGKLLSKHIITATITDNCTATIDSYELSGATNDLVIATGANASGTAFAVGTTTVTYFVEDAAGNIDSCSFDVTVIQVAIRAIISLFV